MNGYNPFSLEGKVILVTGASSGIGRAVAVGCAKLGANVIVTGRNSQRLNETRKALAGNGHLCFSADITQSDDVERLASSMPEINGVVHCAGLTKILPFQYATRDKLEAVFNTNFYAPIELSRLLLRKKKLCRESSVIFLSSVSGVYCSALASSIYSASKGALNGMVKGMALDLASKRIRVNTITPGVIATDFFKNTGISEEDLRKDVERYPLKRYGKPEEVAYAAIYLLSDASAWITGTNLLIDGGYTLL